MWLMMTVLDWKPLLKPALFMEKQNVSTTKKRLLLGMLSLVFVNERGIKRLSSNAALPSTSLSYMVECVISFCSYTISCNGQCQWKVRFFPRPHTNLLRHDCQSMTTNRHLSLTRLSLNIHIRPNRYHFIHKFDIRMSTWFAIYLFPCLCNLFQKYDTQNYQ